MTLTEMLHDYLGSHPQANPPGSQLTGFLQELSRNHELEGWTEGDWVGAGRSIGLSDDEIAEWMEAAAGWVADTSGGPNGVEPAAWTGL